MLYHFGGRGPIGQVQMYGCTSWDAFGQCSSVVRWIEWLFECELELDVRT